MGRGKTGAGTGVSRRVLAILGGLGEAPVKAISEKLPGRVEGEAWVGPRAIWTILDRYRNYGLVRVDRKQWPYVYSLTAGGLRRLEWIKSNTKENTKENPKQKKGKKA